MLGLLVFATPVRADAPCTGCVLELPKGTDAVPLVVVLHGDRSHAKAVAARWHAAVKAKGWALLALECPKDQGCKDSWWKWDGDPQWVLDQISAVGTQRALGRITFIGWSGGATYLGWHPDAWANVASAVVFHGGGSAPAESKNVAPPPHFFLRGKK